LSLEANRKIAWDFHAAMNNRDLDKAMTLFADDASWIVMPGATIYTKDGIRQYLEKSLRTFPKFIVRDIHPPVVSGDMLTHEYIHEIRTRDGIDGQVPAVVVMEIRDGKIAQVRHYIDKLEGAKQMARGGFTKWIVSRIARQVEALINP